MADLNEINSSQAIKIVGSDSSGIETDTVNALKTNPNLTESGLIVRPIPYEPNTYSAAVTNLVIDSFPTDIFDIIGSSTKIIRITKIILTGTTTSGSPILVSVSLIKRSSINTGGIRSPIINVANDSIYTVGTANVGSYTMNPIILGTNIGNVSSIRAAFQDNGIQGNYLIWDFPIPLVLRGNSEQLAINFDSTTIAGNNISIYISWQEV